MRVVVLPVDHRGAGEAGVEHIGSLHHRHGGEVAAERPAVDPDPVEVELLVPLAQRLQATHLIGERQGDQVVLDGAMPVATAIRGASPVNRHHDVAVIGKPLGQPVAARIAADHDRGRAAVHVEDHRVARPDDKVARPDDHRVETGLAVRPCEFDGGDRLVLGDGGGHGLEAAFSTPQGERRAEIGRFTTHRDGPRQGPRDRMDPGLPGLASCLPRFDRHAVDLCLCRVGAGLDPGLVLRVVQESEAPVAERGSGDASPQRPVRIADFQLATPVSLRGPEEPAAVGQPAGHRLIDFDPGVVGLGHQRFELTGIG